VTTSMPTTSGNPDASTAASTPAPPKWFPEPRNTSCTTRFGRQPPSPQTAGACIGCLEGRLGRQLTASDFTDVPLNDLSIADGRYAWSWRTPRLISRLSGLSNPTTQMTADTGGEKGKQSE
jgi:hypothetical protein